MQKIGTQTTNGPLMRSFQCSTDIAAAPETIWALLTDADRYPEWNSTVHAIDGEIAPGRMLAVYTTATPGRGFPLKVTVFEPARHMVWVGELPLGLFRGTRTFTLTPSAGGLVRFEMVEAFSGPLAPVITRMIPDLQPQFDRFAADLKAKAEAAA